MAVSLYDPEEKVYLTFPIAPHEIKTSASSEDATIKLDHFGTLTRPTGRPPTTYAWEGTFYAVSRRGQPYVTPATWRPPEDCKYQLENWHDRQPMRTKPLELLVDATLFPQLYKPVYITRLDFSWAGGWGDLGYSIELTEWRNVAVGVYTETYEEEEGEPTPEEAEEPAIPTEVTVVQGDTLWGLAQQHLGDGLRWPEIYELNQETIGVNPDLIYPGQVFTIPGGTVSPEEVAGVGEAVGAYAELMTQAQAQAHGEEVVQAALRNDMQRVTQLTGMDYADFSEQGEGEE
jgi:nucleoid-associated protein YgaU